MLIDVNQEDVERQIRDNRNGDNVVTWDWDNASVHDININNRNLRQLRIQGINVNINNSVLDGFILRGASISGLFANSIIGNSNLSNVSFNEVRFSNTIFDNVNLTNTMFDNVTFTQTTTLTNVNLTGCVFQDVIFDRDTTFNNCYWITSHLIPVGFIITSEFINFAINSGYGGNISQAFRPFNERNIQRIEVQTLRPIPPAAQLIRPTAQPIPQPIQRQGLAYEVHNAFDNLLPSHPELPTDKRRDYLKLIKMERSPTYTSETRLIMYIKILFQRNIPRLFDEPDSSILLSKFNSLMENKASFLLKFIDFETIRYLDEVK